MEKENITNYEQKELSLRVFKDEWLLDVLRAWGFGTLKEELDHLFIYSREQLKTLIKDIKNE